VKKIIPILFVVFFIYGLTQKDEILIPDYAIRFRVIANSNSIEDQTMKLEVKNQLEKDLNNLMQKASTSKEAKKIIEDNLKNIRTTVNTYTKNNKVSFGKNYFPEKEYHGVTYPKGEYDSLVVTLGSGVGNNWWCVMFPPLCLLEAKEDGTEEINYSFYVKDVLNKYFS